MFELKPLSVAVKRALSTAAIAATAIAPVVGQAQEDTIEEVVITGSRIKTDANLQSSSPVTMIKAEEIAYRGITRVEDLLNDLPSIVPENTGNESNGATGTATIDLRGLTSDRTLVLTNGHRMGFGDVFDLAPDVNAVPAAKRATAVGMSIFGMHILGDIPSPWLIGKIADTSSLGEALLIVPFAVLACGIIWCFGAWKPR